MRRLEAHTDTVSAVAASTATVATGAWDCSVRLWQWHKLFAAAADAASGDAGDAPAGKRSRSAAAAAGGAADAGNAAAVVTECAAVLGDHSQVGLGRVSCNMHAQHAHVAYVVALASTDMVGDVWPAGSGREGFRSCEEVQVLDTAVSSRRPTCVFYRPVVAIANPPTNAPSTL